MKLYGIGVAWLITQRWEGGGRRRREKSNVGVRNFNLRGSQVIIKWARIGLNQSLTF